MLHEGKGTRKAPDLTPVPVERVRGKTLVLFVCAFFHPSEDYRYELEDVETNEQH